MGQNSQKMKQNWFFPFFELIFIRGWESFSHQAPYGSILLRKEYTTYFFYPVLFCQRICDKLLLTWISLDFRNQKIQNPELEITGFISTWFNRGLNRHSYFWGIATKKIILCLCSIRPNSGGAKPPKEFIRLEFLGMQT